MKRISLILLLIVLAITSVYAQVTNLNGSGTESDPYLVENLQDLITISQVDSLWSAHFIQTADIDALSTSELNNGSGFSPIGSYYSGNYFTGTYNGQYHTISNLFINRPSTFYIGLFGYILNAEISNIGIVDAEIVGISYVGGLVGESSSSIISNSYSTGSVSGSRNFIGGLVGYSGLSIISNCYATGTVSGSDAGGLIGLENHSTISNSYSTGEVSGLYSVGGLISSSYSSTISNCYATGDVSGGLNGNVGGLIGQSNSAIINTCYASGNVTGSNNQVGGLIGASSSAISNSYATGNVTSSGTGNRIGGLVGSLYDNSSIASSINNSYATGAVSGNLGVGGLVGYSSSSSSIISNSYSTGEVSGSNNYVGGLIGYSNSDISNSYATGDVSGIDKVGGLIGSSCSSSTISNSYAKGMVSGNSNIGGLVGYSSSTISNSYSTGEVSGYSNIGGFLGYNYQNSNSINNSFWDMETSGQTVSAGGTGKTTQEMKTLFTYLSSGWDFVEEIDNGTENIWTFFANDYPHLSYENYEHDLTSSLVHLWATTSQESINLYWSISDANRILLGYDIYRDNEVINEGLITDIFFNDIDVNQGEYYSYYVKAIFDEEESISSNVIEVLAFNSTTEVQSPDNLQLYIDLNNAQLDWDAVTDNSLENETTQILYIISYNDGVSLSEDAYYYLDHTTYPNYTHVGVGNTSNIMFYRVKAYKNINSATLSQINELVSHKCKVTEKEVESIIKKAKKTYTRIKNKDL